jgi:hypothetical protein
MKPPEIQTRDDRLPDRDQARLSPHQRYLFYRYALQCSAKEFLSQWNMRFAVIGHVKTSSRSRSGTTR